MAENCIFCGKGVSVFGGRIIFRGGAACAACLRSAGIGRVTGAESKSSADIRAFYDRGRALMRKFSPTLKFDTISFDDNNRLMLIDGTIVEYSQIIGYNITNNSNAVSCSQLSVSVSLKNAVNSSEKAAFIVRDTKIKSIIYNGAKIYFDDCVAKLAAIVDDNKSAASAFPAAGASAADELLKFKKLLDMGAITQAEYDAKKKQLLGL